MLGEQLRPAPFVAGLVLVGLTIIAGTCATPIPPTRHHLGGGAGAVLLPGRRELVRPRAARGDNAVAATVLLYFKAQLRGMATRLEQRDWISILQLACSLVILPMLPDEEMGPPRRAQPAPDLVDGGAGSPVSAWPAMRR